MENIYVYGILLVISFFVCYFTEPLAIKFAVKKGIIDNPKQDDRRVHKKPTPRAGGIAIIASIMFSLLLYYIASIFIDNLKVDNRFFGYIIGALIIGAMGLIDDIKNLKAMQKFLMQIVAATIVYIFGISIIGVKIPFIYKNLIDFGIFAYPVTVIWVLAITNAVNLIDGLDGLAAGISSISAISLLTIFAITGAPIEVVVITIALVGATLGFLPYNFNPAKTFMGDVGSNFLGFTLAVVSIMGMAKGYTVLAIVAPIIILGIPIFDMVFAIVRRLWRGQSVMTADKDHVHHRLLRRGLSQKQTVLILYGFTSILGITAVAITANMIYQLILLILAISCILAVYIVYKKMKKEEDEEGEILTISEKSNSKEKTNDK